MSELATINGIQYIGCTAPNESVPHHTGVMDASQTIENAVLAGPVTFPNVMIITGNVVIV
jgi:hypothetical protein